MGAAPAWPGRGAITPFGERLAARGAAWPAPGRPGTAVVISCIVAVTCIPNLGCRKSSLELEAREIYVAPGARFSLLARLPGLAWDWNGEWNPDPLNQVTPPAVLASFTMPPNTDKARITVRSGRSSAKATIRRRQSNRSLALPHVPAARPTVALFWSATGSCEPHAMALVGAAPVPRRVQQCHEVALFPGSQGDAMIHRLSETKTEVQFWADPPQLEVDLMRAKFLEDDPRWREWLAFTNRVLLLNRVGVEILEREVPELRELKDPYYAIPEQEVAARCSTLIRGMPEAHVTVVLAVDMGGVMSGHQCRHPTDPARSLILVSRNASYDVVVHELGHAFGLDHADGGDVGHDNVMVLTRSTATARARTWLTAGQLFRIHFSSGSVVGASRPPVEQRSCPAQCPPVHLDPERGE